MRLGCRDTKCVALGLNKDLELGQGQHQGWKPRRTLALGKGRVRMKKDMQCQGLKGQRKEKSTSANLGQGLLDLGFKDQGSTRSFRASVRFSRIRFQVFQCQIRMRQGQSGLGKVCADRQKCTAINQGKMLGNRSQIIPSSIWNNKH